MTMTRRNLMLGAAAGILYSASAKTANINFPTKAIRLVVPYGAGGPTDTVARIVAERMSDLLRQPVIVDNRGGAGGNIGTAFVAGSPPDGYTLLIGTNNTLAANISVFSKLPFDPIKDFTPIGMLFYAPSMVAVNPSFPAKNVSELLNLLKRKPNEYSFASGGIGASSHFAGELMNKLVGVHMTHIPYKSDALAVNDAIAGQVPIVFCNISSGMKFQETGQLRALGVTSAKRVPAFPNLPAIAESGLPTFDISAWFSMMAPAKTPLDVVAALNTVLNQILREQAVADRIVTMGGIPAPGTAAQVEELIRTEIPKWGTLAREANIRLD